MNDFIYLLTIYLLSYLLLLLLLVPFWGETSPYCVRP